MKRKNTAVLFSLACVSVLVILSCSKGGRSNSPTDSGTGSGGGGGTTSPPYYYVKTIGVSGGQVVLDSVNKILRFKFTNGFGNNVQLWPGSDLQVEMMNANAEPQVVVGDYDVPRVKYPNLRLGGPLSTTTVVDADSAAYLYFRIRGFDVTKSRFSQLNLIMCNDSVGPAGTAGSISFIQYPVEPPPSLFTNAFMKNLFNTRLNKLSIYIDGFRVD